MKWPKYIALIRHDLSSYNILKDQKAKDPEYKKFVATFKNDYRSKETRKLAKIIKKRHGLCCSDEDTPLAPGEGWRARKVGKNLKNVIELPDVIYVSPYLRTKQTFKHMCKGWPELLDVKKYYEDERIREQEHGLLTRYNDKYVFFTLYPEQKEYYDEQGGYSYSWPQGENKPRVKERCSLWTNTIIREFPGEKVLAVTHHISILSIRANFERMSKEEFIQIDKIDKPLNCGVTLYRGNTRNKLDLEFYNRKIY